MLALNHVGLTVRDLTTSFSFYVDVVGMEFESRSPPRLHGEWFDTLTENRDAVIESVHLRLGEFTLQLVQYHAGGGETLQLEHASIGNPHLCLTVDDIDARHARLADQDRHRATPIVKILGGPMRSFYVRDPDGVPVEFLQPSG